MEEATVIIGNSAALISLYADPGVGIPDKVLETLEIFELRMLGLLGEMQGLRAQEANDQWVDRWMWENIG